MSTLSPPMPSGYALLQQVHAHGIRTEPDLHRMLLRRQLSCVKRNWQLDATDALAGAAF